MSFLLGQNTRRLGAMIVIAAVAMPERALSQDRRPVVPFEGTQAFQHILMSAGLKPIRELSVLNGYEPKDTVVVLFGQLEVLEKLARQDWRLASFFNAGGALLIASDHDDEGRLASLGVAVSGLVKVPPEMGFGNKGECPLLSKEFWSAEHPIFKNVSRGIATNCPSRLSMRGGRVAPQAWFLPVGVRPQGFGPTPVFAASTPPNDTGRGRILILAGHGVFVNGMLAQTEVDNLIFAANCVNWISAADGSKKRQHALFIEDGKIHSDFDVPLAQLPPLPIPPVRVVDQLLRGIEEEDLINRILHENVSRNQILHGVMILLSIGLIVVARRSLLRSRYRLDTKAPLVAPSLEKALSDVPVVGQRHRALLLQGNLLEAAQMLAQLWFEQHVPAEKLKPGLDPPVQIHAGWWQRRSLEREVQRLWNLANGNDQAAISRTAFQKLMASVERLSTAHNQGVLRFV